MEVVEGVIHQPPRVVENMVPKSVPKFISQLSQDSNSQLSMFVDATHEFENILEVLEFDDAAILDRVFPKNS